MNCRMNNSRTFISDKGKLGGQGRKLAHGEYHCANVYGQHNGSTTIPNQGLIDRNLGLGGRTKDV